MASVYKHPASSKWYAKIKCSDGLWRGVPLSGRHSGPESIPFKAALLEAQEREEMEQSQARGELTLQAVVEAGKRTMERNHGAKLKRLSIRDHFTSWLKNRSLKISESTKTVYAAQVARFLSIIGDKADKSLTSLRVELLEAHRDALLAEGIAAATVIIHCKTIGSALADAHAKGKLPNNPFDALDLPVKESEEKHPFTEKDVRAILAHAEGEWKTACLFGIYTGARLGDCVKMRWEGVNLFEGSLTFTPEKQKRGMEKPLTIALHPTIADHLKTLAAQFKGPAQGLVTPELSEKGPGGRSGLSGQFASIMKKAGVSRGQVKGKGLRNFSAKSFHSFRHTLTTMLAKGGASEEIRRKVTGHKSKEVHALYTHHDLDDQRKAVGKLPSFTRTD